MPFILYILAIFVVVAGTGRKSRPRDPIDTPPETLTYLDDSMERE